MKQEILSDTHALVSDDDVYRKILSAAQHMRDKRLWYSDRKFSMSLQQGVSEYGETEGLPAGCAEIVGRNLYVLIGGSEDQRQPVVRIASSEFDYEKQLGTSQSQPEVWDFQYRKLRLLPVPISSADVLVGRFVRSVEVPKVRYENAAYKYYSPDNQRELTAAELDSFDSDWFDQDGAYHMVRNLAMYKLYKETLRDPEVAQDFLQQWLEQVGVLEDETEQRTSGATEITAHIID